MSEQIKDGGPAFPAKVSVNRDTGEIQPHQFGSNDFYTPGLSLRDYFATHAPPPPGWWIEQYGATTSLSEHGKLIADWSWTYADAMLAAREAKS